MENVSETESAILSPEQQKRLDEAKIKTRIEDEKYLRSHPEIKLMLSAFTKYNFQYCFATIWSVRDNVYL